METLKPVANKQYMLKCLIYEGTPFTSRLHGGVSGDMTCIQNFRDSKQQEQKRSCTDNVFCLKQIMGKSVLIICKHR